MSASPAVPESGTAAAPPMAGWVRGLLAGLLLIVLSQVAYVIGLVAGLAVPRPDQSARGAVAGVIAGLAAAAVTAGALAVVVRRRRHDLRLFGLTRPRRVLVPTLIAVGLYFPVTVIASLVTDLLHLSGSTTPDFATQSRSTVIFYVVIAIAIAPWIEEISMRGLVYSSLARRFGFWPAALVSGFVWAGAHLVPGVLVIFTCEGVLLAYLRSRTGSVLPGVALHTAQNTAASLLGGVGMLAVAPLCVTVALVLVAWLVLREPSPAAVPT